MDISKLVKLAFVLATAAAATGHLREITFAVYKAEIRLVKSCPHDSWGQLMLLPNR